MSEILQEYPNDKIKEIATKLVKSIFNTQDEPQRIVISEFTIILHYRLCTTKDEGLQFYSEDGIQIVFKKDIYDQICIASILSPEKLIEHLSS